MWLYILINMWCFQLGVVRGCPLITCILLGGGGLKNGVTVLWDINHLFFIFVEHTISNLKSGLLSCHCFLMIVQCTMAVLHIYSSNNHLLHRGW